MAVGRETAYAFLTYLIDFCVQNAVPCSDPLWERCEDIERYMYRCVMTRTCCITGTSGAQIHHVDRVGRRKRREICHIGMRVVPLSPELHMKVHTERDEQEFYESHHIVPIALTEEMVRRLRIGRVEIDYRISRKGGIIMNQDNDEARRFVESCYRTNTVMVNPIVDWTEKDVWEFLHHYGCESNPLYRDGHKRIGCIGCPMAYNQKNELERYPTYKRAYIRAFGKMIDKRRRDGKDCTGIYTSAEFMYKWWIGDDPYQLTLEETEEMMEQLLE